MPRILAMLMLAFLMTTRVLADKGNAIADRLQGASQSSADVKERPIDVIQKGFEQMVHWQFLLLLLLGLGLSVICAWVIAWHPRRSTKTADPASDLEESKTLILLGMVGAVIAEISKVDPNMALVIFGIGALVRFRTVLDNPKVTGKAIMVIVIGLACGMNEWAMAILVTLACWALVFWLESHLSARIKIRVSGKQEIKTIYGETLDFLQRNHCRVKAASVYENKKSMVFIAHVPSDLDPTELETSLRAKLPKASEGVEIDVRIH